MKGMFDMSVYWLSADGSSPLLLIKHTVMLFFGPDGQAALPVCVEEAGW